MDKQAIIDRLVTAYRDADTDFSSAQSGSPEHRTFEFSRIIGKLQGDIRLAAFELGFREEIRAAR